MGVGGGRCELGSKASCLGAVLPVWPGWDPSQMGFPSLLPPAKETGEAGSVGRASPTGSQMDGWIKFQNALRVLKHFKT